MDDEASRKVASPLLRPVTPTPQEERVDAVDTRRPQRHEDQPHPELDPGQDGAEEQERRDGGKHKLEVDHACQRDPERWHARVDERDVGLSLLTHGADGRAGFAYEVVEEVAYPATARCPVRGMEGG